MSVRVIQHRLDAKKFLTERSIVDTIMLTNDQSIVGLPGYFKAQFAKHIVMMFTATLWLLPLPISFNLCHASTYDIDYECEHSKNLREK